MHRVLQRIKIRLQDRLVMWSRVRSWEKGQIFVVNITLLHYCIQLIALLIQIFFFSQVRCDGGPKVSVRSANRWSTVSRIFDFTGLQSICFSWFQTFAVFWMSYAFFWVISQRLKFICRRFGTLCMFHLHRRVGKGKAIPLETWTGPEGSRRLRLPDFKTIGTWRW